MLKKRSVVFAVLGFLLIAALSACNLFKIATSGDEPESDPAESVSQEEEEALLEPDQPGDEYLDCPVEGETMLLAFDHALTIEMDDVNLTHILQQKSLPLYVSGTNADGSVVLSSGPVVDMTYEMMGVMSKCSVELEGTMLATASGTCTNGLVYLTIIENWLPGSGQMVCDDDVIPFNSPGPGEFEHTGADGNGEVFFVVSNAEGYTTLRPFQAGSGYHSWTLYSPEIGVVPLVP